jgi:hypothetical protein
MDGLFPSLGLAAELVFLWELEFFWGFNRSPEGEALWRRAGLVPARSPKARGFLLEQNLSACLSSEAKPGLSEFPGFLCCWAGSWFFLGIGIGIGRGNGEFSKGLGVAEAPGTGEALASRNPFPYALQRVVFRRFITTIQ